RTLQPPLSWQGSSLLSGLDRVEKLKEEPGKDIAISGSITLVGALLREGLLAELSLLVSPIVIGAGKRPFATPDQAPPPRPKSNGSVARPVAPRGTRDRCHPSTMALANLSPGGIGP